MFMIYFNFNAELFSVKYFKTFARVLSSYDWILFQLFNTLSLFFSDMTFWILKQHLFQPSIHSTDNILMKWVYISLTVQFICVFKYCIYTKFDGR